MPRFMDQELFNVAVFMSAWTKHLEGGDKAARDRLIRDVISTYRNSYPADEFEPELDEAVGHFLQWLDDEMTEPGERQFWLNAFRIACMLWNPDGTRKRKRLFGGTWFSPRRKPAHRIENFIGDMATYFLNIHSGKIDLERKRDGEA
jgi:hypothetical protein